MRASRLFFVMLALTVVLLLNVACSNKCNSPYMTVCPRINIQTGALNYDISYDDLPYTIFTNGDVIVTALHCNLSAVHHYNNDYLRFIYSDLPNDGGSVSVSIDNFKTWKNLYVMKY